MNKTDLVFGASLVAQLAALFVKLSSNLISANTASWIGVIAALVSFAAYAFYEKINGTTPPPTPPQQ